MEKDFIIWKYSVSHYKTNLNEKFKHFPSIDCCLSGLQRQLSQHRRPDRSLPNYWKISLFNYLLDQKTFWFQFLWPKISFPLLTLVHQRQQCLWINVTDASYLHDGALTCTDGRHTELCSHTVICEVLPSLFTDFITDSRLFCSAARALNITAIHYLFLALSLAHKDFFRFSQSVDNIMYCRQWDVQSSQFRNIIVLL